MMNLKDIEEAIEVIRDLAYDDELAHAREDALWFAFIKSIADGTFEGDIQKGAQAAMKSDTIDFARWCA